MHVQRSFAQAVEKFAEFHRYCYLFHCLMTCEASLLPAKPNMEWPGVATHSGLPPPAATTKRFGLQTQIIVQTIDKGRHIRALTLNTIQPTDAVIDAFPANCESATSGIPDHSTTSKKPASTSRLRLSFVGQSLHNSHFHIDCCRLSSNSIVCRTKQMTLEWLVPQTILQTKIAK